MVKWEAEIEGGEEGAGGDRGRVMAVAWGFGLGGLRARR